MKVELDKSYPMPGSADVAWEFLQNLEAVAGCMPGAKIIEPVGVGRYKGTVTVKVGPATMSFRGEVEMKDVDAAARTLRLVGKGTDSTGGTVASMDIGARVEPAADGRSTLVGASTVSMSGKAAAFGGRMMNAVADQILKQFADNFAAQVGAIEAQRASAASPDDAGPVAAVADAAPSSPASPAPAPPAATAPVATELNGLALVWAVIKDWLRGLFGKKTA